MTIGNLEGKVAIVTGGSRGIGRGCSLALAEAGATVVVASRKLDACQKVADEIVAAGGKAIAVSCHIGILEQCDALIDQTLATFGRLDILVCNAAVNAAFAMSEDIVMDAANKTIQANILGNLRLCQKAHGPMKAVGGGAIVVVSSVGGRTGAPGVAVYNMTKAANEQMVRNLAAEWGPVGIRVNAVAPGLIRTDMAKLFLDNEAMVNGILRRTPLRRLGEPSDIANVVRFLVSSESAYVTGQTIIVDGGGNIASSS